MAQLSIPQSLIGALIDIADLETLDYFPPTERCAHWSLYDAISYVPRITFFWGEKIF